MKAWRKHNSLLESKAKIHESYGEHEEAKALRKLKLTNKQERRTQFAYEIAEPSTAILVMMYGTNGKALMDQVIQHNYDKKLEKMTNKPAPIYLVRENNKWIRPQNLSK